MGATLGRAFVAKQRIYARVTGARGSVPGLADADLFRGQLGAFQPGSAFPL
jgi:hypothetical protein